MLWIKSLLLACQMAVMAGILGISGDVDGIMAQFDLTGRYDPALVSDFLSMDGEAFAAKYDADELYSRDILYCEKDAWRFQGTAAPAVDGAASYEIDDMRALRFIGICPSDEVIYRGEEERRWQYGTFVKCFGEYAVSLYFQEGRAEENGEETLRLMEVSVIRMTADEGDGWTLAGIYRNQEQDYYRGWREKEQAEWNPSPQGTKAVSVVNGMIPNSPSQIFVRDREKNPDQIFRGEWEEHFSGWIDEAHFLCYNDMQLMMVHLESGRIETITAVGEEEDYDLYGCRYEIRKDQVIAACLDETVFIWDVETEDGEVCLRRPGQE